MSYQQQPYGQQPLGRPPYEHGATPLWGYPPTPPPTNGTAIAALVFSLIFAPLGLILGYVARGQIRRNNQGGEGLAKAAIIIGWIFIAIPLTVLAVIAVMIVVTSAAPKGGIGPSVTVTDVPSVSSAY